MAISMQDIANMAQVSRPVVSAVLNNKKTFRVSEKTRENILRIAQKLSYHRNLLAVSTRTGIVNTIAVITFFSNKRPEIIAGIVEEATVCGYSIRIFSDSNLEATISQILENRINLVISLSSNPQKQEETARLAEKHSLKTIFHFNRPYGGFPLLDVDFFAAASASVNYLAGLGHTRIALLCGPPKLYHAEYRDGFLSAMKTNGLKPVPELLFCRTDYTISTEMLLSLPNKRRPTAVCCVSDAMAYYVFRVAVAKKILLPDELSVIGFGNFMYSDLALVPLTSLNEFLPERGKFSVDILLDRKHPLTDDGTGRYLVKPELVLRSSAVPLAENIRRKKISSSR